MVSLKMKLEAIEFSSILIGFGNFFIGHNMSDIKCEC